MKVISLIIIILILLSTSLVAGIVTNIQFNNISLRKYEKFEATFKIDQSYTNPYNTYEVQVDALISQGTWTNIFPCFYFVPTVNITTEVPSAACWKLRYAFINDGLYQVSIRVQDAYGTNYTVPYAVQVNGAMGKGFIHKDVNDSQYMVYDNGEVYYPLGFNVCWNNNDYFTTYQKYMNNMAPAEVNCFRYWMCGFAKQDLEYRTNFQYPFYSGYGLGKYNQKSAALLDAVVDLAEQKNIPFYLVLENHGKWSTSVNPNWTDNPYYTANGGFLANPAEFFNNVTALTMTKKRYRYIVARWAYSPAILSWELFNELNYANYESGSNNADKIAWHETMAAYIRSIDPFNHILATSTTKDNILKLFDTGCPSLDQLHFHNYSTIIGKTVALRSEANISQCTNCSIVAGEFGLEGFNYTTHGDKWGDHVRYSTWLSLFKKTPALFWYWEFIDKWILFNTYKSVSVYLKGEDFRGLTSFNVTISGAPAKSSLDFYPGRNWEPSDYREFWIDETGSVIGMETLDRYVMGYSSGNSAWGTSTTFHAQFDQAGTAGAYIVDVSWWPSHSHTLQIITNGMVAGSITTGGGVTLTVNINPGYKDIIFQVASADWMWISSYSFTGVGAYATGGYGLKDKQRAYGYIQDTRNGDWVDPASAQTMTNISLIIPGMNNGTYLVKFFDPKTAVESGVQDVEVDDGTLIVNVPDFREDMAFKAINYSYFTKNTDKNNEEYTEPYAVFPTCFNPNEQDRARIYFAGKTTVQKVIIYNTTGRIVKTFNDPYGKKYVEWDGKSDTGLALEPNIYVVYIKGDDIEVKVKMILVK